MKKEEKFFSGYVASEDNEHDYAIEDFNIPFMDKEIAKSLKHVYENREKLIAKLPIKVDNRKYCGPIKNQGKQGSCSAFAGCSAMEFLANIQYPDHKGKTTELSQSFLYYCSKKLYKKDVDKDSGSLTRLVMCVLATIGVPPIDYFPYDENVWNKEPDWFVASLARNNRLSTYIRLDKKLSPKSMSAMKTMDKVKLSLSRNYPIVCGFDVYASFRDATKNHDGHIPYPIKEEKSIGSHIVLFVGYDDNMEITHPMDNSRTKGAFIFQNSYGDKSGDKGFAYLPYKYLESGKITDIWTLLQSKRGFFGEFDYTTSNV